MTNPVHGLLAADEPPPVHIENHNGGAPFFLTCEHASRRLPRSLGTLGLTDDDLTRHIAWDIGALEVARELARLLDAPLAVQNYSRLVCDCNRRPDVDSYIVEISEHTEIPGNRDLTPAEREQRTTEVHRPFHDRIARVLDERERRGQNTILVSVHSFTPVFKGYQRPWHVGVLYNRVHELARATRDRFAQEAGLNVGDNEPYNMGDDTDYTIPIHGEQRGLACVEIEMRQDLLLTGSGRREWATRLHRVLRRAAADLELLPIAVP